MTGSSSITTRNTLALTNEGLWFWINIFIRVVRIKDKKTGAMVMENAETFSGNKVSVQYSANFTGRKRFRNFYHDTWLGYVREKGKGHAVATNEDLVSSRFMHLTFQCMSYSFLTSSLLHITFTNETPLTTSPSQPQSGRLCVWRAWWVFVVCGL